MKDSTPFHQEKQYFANCIKKKTRPRWFVVLFEVELIVSLLIPFLIHGFSFISASRSLVDRACYYILNALIYVLFVLTFPISVWFAVKVFVHNIV